MEISRFKEILTYSNENKECIEAKIKEFYFAIGMEHTKELLNLIQIVRPQFQKKGYMIVELPFSDKEIGALCYRDEGLGYTFLNTSLPKVSVNFALCHEIYHVFFPEKEAKDKVELFMNESYYENEEEHAANVFAGMLLMPEKSFTFMYHKFQAESEKEDEGKLSVLAKLMSYFEVPYMAALIRCYELKLFESGVILEELMKVDLTQIRTVFQQLWLNENILDATKNDDYKKLESFVETTGRKYIGEEYLNERTVRKAIENMRALYAKIKGE